MILHTFRLTPGHDLKTEIEKYAAQHRIKSGFIITCVGGLSQATLRMAGAAPDRQDIRTYKGDFEITSLVGTISRDGVHLHLSISDQEGKSWGGHLKEGTLIHPTAELVIGEDEQTLYTRKLDPSTGFPELVVQTKP